MAAKMFGEFFKNLRQARGLTLREYCRTFDKDPAYISRMERGKIAPPINHQELEKLALSLGLQEDSEEWTEFFTLAAISAGRIPQEIMSDEEVLQHLPLLLRTITGKKLDKSQLESLVEVIKTA